jgi:hypothetical protein
LGKKSCSAGEILRIYRSQVFLALNGKNIYHVNGQKALGLEILSKGQKALGLELL